MFVIDFYFQVAKVLEGFVKRKVIKQTVMTTVYGVTRFGAKLQIAKQLKDIDNFPKEHVWSASSYLAGNITIFNVYFTLNVLYDIKIDFFHFMEQLCLKMRRTCELD